MEKQRSGQHDTTWDSFAAHAADGGLLQSRAWGQFQEQLGRRVEYIRLADCGLRIADYDGAVAQTLVIEQRLPFGFSYVYSPRGPIVGNSGFRIPDSGFIVDALAREVRKRFPRAIFFRFEPPYEQFIIRNPQFVIQQYPKNVQPATTLVIDLTKSEDELLSTMKEKTRYNIRLAERHGVTVRSSTDAADLERFLNLLDETARRDGFRAHPQPYYKTMWKTLAPEHLKLFLAEHHGKLLAAALVAFNQPTIQTGSYKLNGWAYYLHGASTSENRELMAPYALHWQIMREAKSRGCTHYDFWGIDEARWPGVTRFKTGFAPNTKPTTYCGTWDVVFRPKLYAIYRRFARMR